MPGEYVPRETGLVGFGTLPNEGDCLSSRINQCVERGNDWSRFSQRSDAENYIDGNIKFTFEYVERRYLYGPKLGGANRSDVFPTKYATAEKCAGPSEPEGKTWYGSHKHFTGYLIPCWNKQFMFVENVHLVDQVEKIIPSRFTVWEQFPKSTIKAYSGVVGQSLLYSTVKRVCFLTERELNSPKLPRITIGRNDLPIGMIESGTEIVDDISDDKGCLVYDGVIIFGAKDSLSGFGICFDSEAERSRFTEKFVKLIDVFRGPVNLEGCTICHGKT